MKTHYVDERDVSDVVEEHFPGDEGHLWAELSASDVNRPLPQPFVIRREDLGGPGGKVSLQPAEKPEVYGDLLVKYDI